MDSLKDKALVLSKLKELSALKIPVYIRAAPNHSSSTPSIGSIRETFGIIVTFDETKFLIEWDNKHPIFEDYAIRSRDIFSINDVHLLLTKDEWENSEEFKTLSSGKNRFVLGQIVYLSSRYSKTASSEQYPKIGSAYETHGKIVKIVANRNGTKSTIHVRWFLRNEWYGFSDADLVSADEYLKAKLNDTPQYHFATQDCLIPSDSVFIQDDRGYFKTTNESIFVSIKFKNLFKRLGSKPNR